LLIIISVVSTFFAPCVYADSQKIIVESGTLETPNITILENTTTSQVYQVGNYQLKVNYPSVRDLMVS
jgi:hypothetical protein